MTESQPKATIVALMALPITMLGVKGVIQRTVTSS